MFFDSLAKITKMVFEKMDHLKRSIEIEILCSKNQISLLILACVAGRFVKYMCWAYFLWDGEIKFDLHPNLWLCYQKQQHVPHVSHHLAITKSNGINWKKLLKIKTVVAADKINNYFCLEVNYSCGRQF